MRVVIRCYTILVMNVDFHSKSWLRCCLILFFLTGFSSCAYRFSNLHSKNPKGVKTVAVEAIYDSSQVPIPHDILWKTLQQTIASSGHLKLSTPDQADAMLRIHIENAALNPSGQSQDIYRRKDPKIQDSGRNPPSFSAYESLKNARALYPDSTASIVATAEIWNLTTKKLLLQRSYSLANGFRAFRGDFNANTTLKNNFVQYQEALNTSYYRMSRDLANRIVSDLLIQ